MSQRPTRFDDAVADMARRQRREAVRADGADGALGWAARAQTGQRTYPTEDSDWIIGWSAAGDPEGFHDRPEAGAPWPIEPDDDAVLAEGILVPHTGWYIHNLTINFRNFSGRLGMAIEASDPGAPGPNFFPSVTSLHPGAGEVDFDASIYWPFRHTWTMVIPASAGQLFRPAHFIRDDFAHPASGSLINSTTTFETVAGIWTVLAYGGGTKPAEA